MADRDAYGHGTEPDAATMAGPAGRRDAIDVARVLALALVVLGHLLLAVVDRAPDGTVRGANLLSLLPSYAWIAAAAPMPVFFAAAGWANSTTRLARAVPRLRTLVGVATVVVALWALAVVTAELVAGDPGVVGTGARISTQPFWFLAAYLPFAVSGPLLARMASRHPVAAIGGCLVLLAALDLGRFALDAPTWTGWAGFYAAWGVPWLAGAWWRDRWARRPTREKTVGLVLLSAAGLTAAALVAYVGYQPSLIDVVPGARSNTTPPTLYTGVAGLAQTGGLIVAAGTLDAVGRRWRRLWDRAGEAAIAVYAWHLTALSLCAATIAAGVPTPRRLTAAWWLTRPVWLAAVLAVSGLLSLATAAVDTRLAGHRRERAPSRTILVTGVVVATAAAAAVGLQGPRSVVLSVVCVALLASGWYLLGGGTPGSGGGTPGSGGAKRNGRR